MTSKWTYGESSSWYGNCLLNNQTPINIDTELIQQCRDLCELKFSYKPSKCSVEFIKDQNLSILYDKGSGVIYNNVYYKLKEITIHTPSLHQIDGNYYDMEVCLVHSLTDQTIDSNGLIVSVLFNEGNYYGDTENFMNQFINEIKINNKEMVDVSEDWGAKMLLPLKKSFFVYNGSLHYPPCSPMKHIVMDTIGNIGPTNLEILHKNLGKNTRSIHPLGTRSIFYNSGKKEEQTEEREVVKSNDKFLRCKKKEKKEIKEVKPIVTEPIKPKDTGLANGTKEIIKKTFILVNIVTIFVISIYLTKYLFKHEIAQKIIVGIVGTEKLGNPNILNIWRNDETCLR
jgi:carbonic anhydrase